MVFNKESDFEEALIKILCKYGWLGCQKQIYHEGSMQI